LTKSAVQFMKVNAHICTWIVCFYRGQKVTAFDSLNMNALSSFCRQLKTNLYSNPSLSQFTALAL